MAQQPAKLVWKEQVSFGLSASQFGAALGFCGKISDYVDYLRNRVGTDQEFKGNACTDHGIRIEPKSRALYELLTGIEVKDGSFFLSENGLLGCSPDGRVYYDIPAEKEVHASCSKKSLCGTGGAQSSCTNATSTFEKENPSSLRSSGSFNDSQRIRISVPFQKAKRQRANSSSSLIGLDEADQTNASSSISSPLVVRFQKMRLLEIKSPFLALYDGSRPKYQPFGIPLSYMCQMQGQMTIANCDECDFFVYLNYPSCQCVCWRVKRSESFWRWAEPKLLQLVHWVRNGPPQWMDRSFEYKPFDFSTIEVTPVVFPFDITTRKAIEDSKRFPFFARFPSPYDGDSNELGLFSSVDHSYVKLLHSDFVNIVFNVCGGFVSGSEFNDAEMTCRCPEENIPMIIGCTCECNKATLYQVIGWNALSIGDEDTEEDLVSNHPSVSTITLFIAIPTNWESGEVEIRYKEGSSCEEKSTHVRLYKRDFFLSLSNVIPVYNPATAEPLIRSQTPTPKELSQADMNLSEKIRLSLTPHRPQGGSCIKDEHPDTSADTHLQSENEDLDKNESSGKFADLGLLVEVGPHEMVEMAWASEDCVGVYVFGENLSSDVQALRKWETVDSQSYMLVVLKEDLFSSLLATSEPMDEWSSSVRTFHLQMKQEDMHDTKEYDSGNAKKLEKNPKFVYYLLFEENIINKVHFEKHPYRIIFAKDTNLAQMLELLSCTFAESQEVLK